MFCNAVRLISVSETEAVMLSIYNTLLQLRYPEITKAEPKNVDTTILTGESRISLLSWLLTEKSIYIAAALDKLKGAALEDELLKYYSEMGICNKKDILLGNCTMKEQLPTLKLLLDFMENVHIESFNAMHDMEESVDDILKKYINGDSKVSSSMSSIKPKLSYPDAVEYFQTLKKKYGTNCEINTEIKDEAKADDSLIHSTEIENEDLGGASEDSSFSTEKEKFLEVFSGIGSWPVCNTNRLENISYRMDTDIKNIYKDFSSLKEILETKNEISKITIPKALKKTETPLTSIVEQTVICMEEVQNMYENYALSSL